MTPNDIEVLLHCHVSPQPHPRNNAPAVQAAIACFMRDELIEPIVDCPQREGQEIYITTAKGKALVAKLCATPSHVAPATPSVPYTLMGEQIGKLVEEKQVAYGDSFGKSGDILRVLYPQGIAPEQIDDALCIVRIVDQLFRIATDKDALGESPYRDIAGYGLLGAFRSELARN